MLKKPAMRLLIAVVIGMVAGACMLADDEAEPPREPDGIVNIDVRLKPLPDEPPVRAPDPAPDELAAPATGPDTQPPETVPLVDPLH